MADYKYVKKFVILDKNEFWPAALFLGSGILCLIGLALVPFQHPTPPMLQIVPLGIMGVFNTMNGLIRFETRQPYKWKRVRVPKTEAEKLLGD